MEVSSSGASYFNQTTASPGNKLVMWCDDVPHTEWVHCCFSIFFREVPLTSDNFSLFSLFLFFLCVISSSWTVGIIATCDLASALGLIHRQHRRRRQRRDCRWYVIRISCTTTITTGDRAFARLDDEFESHRICQETLSSSSVGRIVLNSATVLCTFADPIGHNGLMVDRKYEKERMSEIDVVVSNRERWAPTHSSTKWKMENRS